MAPAAEIVWPIMDLVELTSSRGASAPRVVGVLQEHEAGALAHHEAVAARVEGAAGRLRRAVLARHHAEQAEELHLDRRDDALGAAGQRQVDLAAANRPVRLADRLGRRGAG